MLKKIILLGSFVLLFSSIAMGASNAAKVDSAHVAEAPYFTSLDSAMAANTSGKNILIDFYANW